MPHNSSLRRSVTWLLFGNTSVQILTFLFGIVLARLLAPADFGMLVTVQVFTGLAGFVSGGGMGQALVRAKDATEDDYKIVFTLQLMIGIALYGLFFALAPLFARWYDQPLYEPLLRVSALTFIIRPLVNLPNSILHRNMQFKAQTGARILTLLVSSATSIGLAASGWGVWSLVAGGIAGSVTNALALSALSGWRPGLSLHLRRGGELARYGFLVSVNDVVVYIRNQVSNLIIGRVMTMEAVGLFNKSDSLNRMPHGFITTSVYQVLFRALAKEQENDARSGQMFLQAIRLVALYCLPCYVALHWLALPLIATMYGERWVSAAEPLALLALTGPFMIVNTLSGAVLAARSWLDKELKVQIVQALLTAIAVLVGARYGLSGVAWGLIAVSGFGALQMYWLASRCLGVTWLQLALALKPAALLNALLAVTIEATMRLLDLAHIDSTPLRLIIISGVGALFYGSLFLLAPLEGLETERDKWRSKLLDLSRKFVR
jgi:O-antigen/teichoic acid export membrane protein